ncbi:lipase family protein [Nocardia sputorum]|uniref:lipase family protein n=1 Tax=Nocardia sputorum TaxID=2984338 RepID=UPI003D9C9625
MGYSGGAIATGWAAEPKRDYAPELNVVGTAEGGIPADLSAALRMANGNLSAGLIFAGALGVSREYPELRRFLDDNANGLGRQRWTPRRGRCGARWWARCSPRHSSNPSAAAADQLARSSCRGRLPGHELSRLRRSMAKIFPRNLLQSKVDAWRGNQLRSRTRRDAPLSSPARTAVWAPSPRKSWRPRARP